MIALEGIAIDMNSSKLLPFCYGVLTQIQFSVLFVKHKNVPMVSGSLCWEWLHIGHDLVALQHIVAAGNVGTVR